MIAVTRRVPTPPAIRTRAAEPAQGAAPSKKKKREQRLQPAGQRSGQGAASVLPYLSLPR